MRIKLLILSFFILMYFLNSCEEDFSINAPEQDVYTISCILRNDSNIQYAVLTKNIFTDDGTVPTDNILNRNINGAEITILYQDSVLMMQDTSILLDTDSGLQNINCYYVKNINLLGGETITLVAKVDEGNILTASVQVPEVSFGNFNMEFPQYLEPGFQIKPKYTWEWITDSEATSRILNIPKLEIFYKKAVGNNFVSGKVDVPLAQYLYYNEAGQLMPVLVDYTFYTSCITLFDYVNETMQSISGDDPDKSSYTITKASFSVTCFDSDLSKFYSANKTYSNSFSIKLRQTDYTNIDGGRGILGVICKQELELEIDSFYIKSFGYKYGKE